MSKNSAQILVVGSGLSGTVAAWQSLQLGAQVTQIALSPIQSSPSMMNADQWRDWRSDDAVADLLTNSGAILENKQAEQFASLSWQLLQTLRDLGVPFARDPEHDFWQALPTTSRRILGALDFHLRRPESEGRLSRHWGWELLAPIFDSRGFCRGVTAQNRMTAEFKVFFADAVVLATGGFSRLFSKTTAALSSTGAAIARCFRDGAELANLEFMAWEPLTLSGNQKDFAIPDFVTKQSGARVLASRSEETWELALKQDQHKSNDLLVRALHRANSELGSDQDHLPRLDLTGLSTEQKKSLQAWSKKILAQFGFAPLAKAFVVAPSVSKTLGGLWVDAEHRTTLPGLFAAGGASAAYCGGALLPGLALPAAAVGGFQAASAALRYVEGCELQNDHQNSDFVAAECKRHRLIWQDLLDSSGPENPAYLSRELAQTLDLALSPRRDGKTLSDAIEKLDELDDRAARLGVTDKSDMPNQTLVLARELPDRLLLARLAIQSALAREESRGSHFRVDCPQTQNRFRCGSRVLAGAPRVVFDLLSDQEPLKSNRSTQHTDANLTLLKAGS